MLRSLLRSSAERAGYRYRKNFLLKKCRKIRDFPVLTAFLNI
ncbi:hypothetical protein CLOSYM_02140 [[Clostridium] symbiosum ATCC 14940]|uniref:Uncharacterized protein n=1 Tax=[Clostridium] symbiosum ATCC 14940 TaxID=411472 RepID=A0ABC9TYE1_CLOSY|nr:hypothetical protein CLOSYM_02140 [[Clostridium] symbiosum ATCC 14940]